MSLPSSLSTLSTHALDTVRGAAGSLTWAPFVHFSKQSVLHLLQRVEVGDLVILEEQSGVERKFGTPRDKLAATLRVKSDAFWIRVFLFGDMGFAESFMLGEIECVNLVAFFQIFIHNRSQLSNGSTLTASLMSTVTRLARSTNTMSNARLNVSAHYDMSNIMFAAFLSDDMTYSCPIWSPISSGLAEALEDAQMRKLQRFISNARIKAWDHVLEIGTGWGSFAIEAVRRTGCRVTSLTLSVEQKELAEKRIAVAGFEDHITVLLCDYRALPTPEVLYDKVVSIEMLEAVGKEYLTAYFQCVDKLLKPNGGIAAFQCITMPESRYEAYSKGEDFIRKYIFPGGHLPTLTQLITSLTDGSNGTLVVDQVENIGGHYAKTLRLWNQKFQQNFDSRIRPALLEEHSDMREADMDVFRKKWEYYFSYCEAGFNTKTLGDVIITASREGNRQMLEDIPL